MYCKLVTWKYQQFAVNYIVYCKLVYHKLAYLIHAHTYCSVLSIWQGL